MGETIQVGWPGAIATVLPILIIQFFQYLSQKRTEKKVDETKVVADATHTLTNSAMGASLELVVSAYTQLLAKSPGDKSVQAQLDTAKKNLEQHKVNQAIVDAGLKKSVA